MIARPAKPFRSANAGEFSEDAKGRIEIKQYYSAGLRFKNIEPVPQGGFRQMGGTWRKSYGRRPMVSQPLISPWVEAGPFTGTQVVWSAFVEGPVAAVHVEDFAASAGTVTFVVEVLSDGVWVPLTGAFTVAGSAVTRCAGFAPGHQRVASEVRIRATFSTSATVTIDFVAAFRESGVPAKPRFWKLATDTDRHLTLWAIEGFVDVVSDQGWRGLIRVPELYAEMLPDLSFYSEARTVGIFHEDLETASLFLSNPATDHDWSAGLWAYGPHAKVDLGGVYPKTDDLWEMTFRWTGTVELYISMTIDGETTPGIPHVDGAGALVNSGTWTDATWEIFAEDIEEALAALPGLSDDVTVGYMEPGGPALPGFPAFKGGDKTRKMGISFGGDLSGEEYDLGAIITNTADASVLAYHTQVGKTEYEPLLSTGRGWPGGMVLVQDRAAYYRIKAKTGTLALSRVAEYFDLDISATADNAARLDNLRSTTTEVIWAVKESKYLLVFTNRGCYFVNNRTIERNTPMNFVRVSEVSIAKNCTPFDLEGTDYFIGRDENQGDDDASGNQMLSIIYDDVSTAYNADPVSLLAPHLVNRVMRSVAQKKIGTTDAPKCWLGRQDGRLVAGQMIRSQEIMGYLEWIAAHGGLVDEIGVDGRNRLWMAVRRGDVVTYELYDTSIYLHDAITVTPNLAGVISGLPAEWEGRTVHVVADGYEMPQGYVVTGGAIDLQDAYSSAIVGRWQPPVFESMPEVAVIANDDVIFRPGRIHTAQINLIDTTSIAVGANGQPARDIPLLEAADPTDQPMPGKTKMITVTGEVLTGSKVGTTLVITQTRPGRLRVRDYAITAKL